MARGASRFGWAAALAVLVAAKALGEDDAEWPPCYVTAGGFPEAYAGLLHRTAETWNGRPIYRRHDGAAYLGRQETGVWVVAGSRAKLVVERTSGLHATGQADAPQDVRQWEYTKDPGTYAPGDAVLREGSALDCAAEWPDCYHFHIDTYFHFSGFFKRTDYVLDGAPLYHRRPGSFAREPLWLGKAAGEWGVAKDWQHLRDGTPEIFASAATPGAMPQDTKFAFGAASGEVLDAGFHVAAGLCWEEAPPLDTVLPWGGTGDVHPVNGTDYLADFTSDDLIEGTEYQYPIPHRAPFRYIYDIRPSLPHAILSLSPRIVYFERFLPDEDADAIVAVARAKLERSKVQLPGEEAGNGVDDVRTSHQTWLADSVPAVRRLVDRLLAVTGFRRGDNELLQILQYSKAQKYDAHHDYFDPKVYGPTDHNRMLTCFIYLNTPEEGGWTWFPRANRKPDVYNFSKCDDGFRTIPKKGSVVCFYNLTPTMQLDPFSLHGGCPVLAGEKWGGTLWIHTETPHMAVREAAGAEEEDEAVTGSDPVIIAGVEEEG
eukprot:TRINITY_DN2867_c2_g1_i1.p1 TRINITY_DN2867_c2_g1~~TRINITY_DN2867_c2_g1_i1.p1  ORF type:complete len:544 (+),score=189.15 TRINITY_DN2867_c2_g1_i1:48-1679(+)